MCVEPDHTFISKKNPFLSETGGNFRFSNERCTSLISRLDRALEWLGVTGDVLTIS